MALCFAENADAELARRGDGIVGLHAFLDTDEHERWMERERGEGGHRHAERFAAMLRGHHRHTAGEMRHGQLECRLINGHRRGSLPAPTRPAGGGQRAG